MSERKERLRGIDTLWIDAEQPGPSIAIGSLVLCTGDAPTVDEVRAFVATRLDRAPRLSERVVPSRARGVGRPRWRDTEVDMEHHVRQVEVPSPGDRAAVERTVSRIMEGRLDMDRPLWEMHLLTGLSAGSYGIVTRVHHAVADGQGALLTLGHLIDTDQAGTTSLTQVLAEFMAARQSSAAEEKGRNQVLEAAARGGDLTLRALRKVIVDPRGAVDAVGNAATQTGKSVSRSAEAAVGALPRRATILGGDAGDDRYWRSTSVTLADIKTIRAAQGGTVNDVVMALVSAGYERLLTSRGQATDGVYLRINVPVSTRAPGNLAANNQVSALIVQLPVFGEMTQRLSWIREHISKLKDARAVETGKVLADLLDVIPSSMSTVILQADTTIPERTIDSLVTNVPGPPFPLFSQGRPLSAIVPIIALGRPLWCTIGVLSYDGVLNFGITTGTDGELAAEAAITGIQDGLRILLAASRTSPH